MRPWYPWSPGDYARDTKFLTDKADLIYRRLLDEYWMNGGPLPLNHTAIARAIRVDVRVLKRHLGGELSQYWVVKNARLFNIRMDADIKIAKEKQELAAKAGRMGGLAKAKADAMANAIADDLATTTIPTTITNKPINNKDSQQPIDVYKGPTNYTEQDVVDLYHEILKDLIPIKKLTDKLKAQIRAVHQESKLGCHNLEHWTNFFNRVYRSDWLSGRAKGEPSRYSLRGLIETETYTKIAEGQYDN